MPRPVDILKHWHDRAMIDAAQLAAGRRFQELHHGATVGDAAARAALDAICREVGKIDFGLLRRFIAEGAPLTEVEDDNDRRHFARRTRDALMLLAG